MNILDLMTGQYRNSTALCGIVERFALAANIEQNIDDLISQRIRLSTAEDDGLDCLGEIVGASRNIPIPDSLQPAYFGFAEAFDAGDVEHGPQPFDVAPFFDGVQSHNYRLGKEEYRKLIKIKALANIYGCSFIELNKFYMIFFGDRGRVYLREDAPFECSIVFDFSITDIDRAIIGSGAFPAQAGVTYTIEAP